MKATIYFSEINQMLAKKGVKATLAGNYSNSVRVNYPLKIFFVEKNISAIITLKNFSGSTLRFSFSLYGLGSFERMGMNILRNRLPAFVTMAGNNELKVNLSDIRALKKSGWNVSLNHFEIDNYGINVDANMR